MVIFTRTSWKLVVHFYIPKAWNSYEDKYNLRWVLLSQFPKSWLIVQISPFNIRRPIISSPDWTSNDISEITDTLIFGLMAI